MDRKMLFHDHYLAIGLKVQNDPSEFSLRDINDAYKRAARKYHPDKSKGDANTAVRFQFALQAVELLRDTIKRQKYDDEYRAKKREERRLAAEDERTKRMRLDLERREREDSSMSKKSSELERLRRETATFAQSTKSTPLAMQNQVQFTLEQHLAFERDILARAMQYPI